MNSELTAFPIFSDTKDFQAGLTKRELFAVLAMQGLIAHPDSFRECEGDPARQISEAAVHYADRLIEALGDF